MVTVYGFLQQENGGYLLQENGGRLIIASSDDGVPVQFVWCGGPMQLQSQHLRQHLDDEINIVYDLDGNTYITQTIVLGDEDTVIEVPEGAVSVIIRPPLSNTREMFISGEIGDVGIQIHPTLPTFLPLADS